MSHQIGNINKAIEFIKNKKQKPVRNFGIERYNHRNENFTRGLTSRFEPKEENISRLEDKPVEIIQCKEQKQTNKKNGK